MKVADVSIALLNGYGDEGAGDHDLEDERRRHQLVQRKIGSNRKRQPIFSSKNAQLDAAGVGTSVAASSALVRAGYNRAL